MLSASFYFIISFRHLWKSILGATQMDQWRCWRGDSRIGRWWCRSSLKKRIPPMLSCEAMWWSFWCLCGLRGLSFHLRWFCWWSQKSFLREDVPRSYFLYSSHISSKRCLDLSARGSMWSCLSNRPKLSCCLYLQYSLRIPISVKVYPSWSLLIFWSSTNLWYGISSWFRFGKSALPHF